MQAAPFLSTAAISNGFKRRMGNPSCILRVRSLGNSDSETICTHEVVKLDRHHRPQFRAREDRRAGSIVQAPCTIAPIAEIPLSNPLSRPEAMRPIWGARFCRARVASHRSCNAPRSRDASRQSACVHSPLFIPAPPSLLVFFRAQHSQPPIATSP